jgi:DNA polymerase III subunit epsilon
VDAELEKALARVAASEDYRLLRRVRVGDAHCFAEPAPGEALARLAVIDTETTGFNPDLGDRIIDIAVAVCEYGRDSGRLYRVTKRYESLEDPQLPLPPEISRLTGITDAMVKDQRIDEAALAGSLEGVGLVVCHNAAFDRAFLEARYPAFAGLAFACSLHELPWAAWGMASSKLDYLGFCFGLFHDAHRARADVDMLLALLACPVPAGEGAGEGAVEGADAARAGQTLLARLLESARAPSWRIHALGLPFESKDLARARGYHWHDGQFGAPRAWWIDAADEAAERRFLKAAGCRSPLVYRLTARERYRPFSALAEVLAARNADAGG